MEYTRTIERTFSVGAEPALRIANRTGTLIVRGEDREDIEFTATLRVDADSEQQAEELFDALELPISEREGAVEIGPPEFGEVNGARGGFEVFGLRIATQWRGPRVDMVAVVPRRCGLRASSRTGSVSVEGIRANVRVDCRTGRVRISDVEGEVTAETRTGALGLNAVRGAVRAETRTGIVESEDITGDISLSTRTGLVRARGVHGSVTATTRTGGIRLEDIDGAIQASSTTGGVRYRGRIAHPADISVSTGSIRLAVTPDSAFFLDAESGRGTVRSELDVDATREPDAGAPTVRLRTDRGSIRIGPA